MSTEQETDAEHFRRLEREWQNTVGKDLLDVPWQQAGAREVFERQFRRIGDEINLEEPGVVVEVGCGKGHLLHWLAQRAAPGGPGFVGLDVSEATRGLRERGLSGVRADGEFLPLRDASARVLVYDGALHHLIDYEAGLRDAFRVLVPGGKLVLFEPVSSPFTRLVHRVVDPIVFKKVEYESPIDQHFKDYFDEARVLRTCSELGMEVRVERSDFLAYPLTGCYAGSLAGRSPRLMRTLLALEALADRTPLVRSLARQLGWRFLITARKP